jgi:hypothetical protein
MTQATICLHLTAYLLSIEHRPSPSVPKMGTVAPTYKGFTSPATGGSEVPRAWVASPHYRARIAVLRSTRVECGISQREVARRLHKPPSFVNKVEILERRLDVMELAVFARAMGLQPTRLFQRMLEAIPEDFELG